MIILNLLCRKFSISQQTLYFRQRNNALQRTNVKKCMKCQNCGQRVAQQILNDVPSLDMCAGQLF